MNVIRHRQEELEAARKLQRDCVGLHLAPPPVQSWKAIVTSADGVILDDISSKCNSYTRNAINTIACNALVKVGGTSLLPGVNIYGDGFLSIKNTSELIYPGGSGFCSTGTSARIALSTDNTAEDFDWFKYSGELDKVIELLTTDWNDITKVMTVNMSVNFVNSTSGTLTLNSSLLSSILYLSATTTSTGQVTLARDVFVSPIVLPVGASIMFSYVFEYQFPLN